MFDVTASDWFLRQRIFWHVRCATNFIEFTVFIKSVTIHRRFQSNACSWTVNFVYVVFLSSDCHILIEVDGAQESNLLNKRKR